MHPVDDDAAKERKRRERDARREKNVRHTVSDTNPDPSTTPTIYPPLNTYTQVERNASKSHDKLWTRWNDVKEGNNDHTKMRSVTAHSAGHGH